MKDPKMTSNMFSNQNLNKSRSAFLFCISFLLLGLLCPSAHAGNTKWIKCVGDSITRGAGVQDRKTESYPAQLSTILGKDWKVKLYNLGVNGSTMLKKGDNSYWNTNLIKQRKPENIDIFVIMLGTNDSKPGNWKHKDEFAQDYEEMIKALREISAKSKIYAVLPPPAYPGRWGINDQVIKDEIIPRIKEVAEKTGVELIDVYTPLSGKPHLFPDTVHPNAEGAKLIAETVAKALMKH